MKRHFFIKKSNTIYEGVDVNSGYNPVLKLIYGDGISRVLLKVDTDKIKALYNDTYLPEKQTLKHTLCFKNCSSIASKNLHETVSDPIGEEMERASSFSLILFRLPFDFDQGKGSSIGFDYWYDVKSSFDTNGCTWFNATNSIPWKTKDEEKNLTQGLDYGVYNSSFLKNEYEKFKLGEKSIIITEQYFKLGNEDIRMDITEEINNILKGEEENNGFGLAFSPIFEEMKTDKKQYVGFFSDKTNTFFHPFLETETLEPIIDSRYIFTQNKKNYLYLYVNSPSGPINLDGLPECKINDESFIVKQVRKGCYCAEIPAHTFNEREYTMEYDTWSNIMLNGAKEDDVEQTFVILPNNWSISIGGAREKASLYVPCIYGIHDNELLNREEEIEVEVDFIKKYYSENRKIMEKAEYRLYIMENEDEVTVYSYSPLDIKGEYNSFMLYTEDLIPNKYFLDIRITENGERKVFKDVVHFIIEDEAVKRFI